MRASPRASPSRSLHLRYSRAGTPSSLSLSPPTSRPPAMHSRTIWVRRQSMRKRLTLLVLALAVLVGSMLATTARSQSSPLTIYAAASLTDVFRALDPAQKYSFAGSNALETQIKNGAPADLFASAAALNTQR